MAGRLAGCTLGLALILALAPAISRAAGPNDDWEMIEDQKSDSHAQPANAASPESAPGSPDRQGAAGDHAQAAGEKVFLACGERARAAQEPYLSIVATLNHMWNSDAKIYESVEPTSPHARTGGCIFYNRDYLQSLTRHWMGIDDPDQLEPMLYAINAHELAHVVHGDLGGARATDVSGETKELEADRFAGYTLRRLNMKRFDAADTEHYYQAIGDDFLGVHASHGTAKQRTTAFQEGWDQARMGLPEDSNRPVGGLDSSDDGNTASNSERH